MKKSLKFSLFVCMSIALIGLAVLGIEPAAAHAVFDGGLFSQNDSLAFVGAGLIVNRGTLTTIFTGFKTLFQNAFDQAKPQWPTIAMEVKSTTKSQTYGWLGKFPNVRKWLGDRVVQGMSTHKFTIENDDFESTIGVDRNDIEDDEVGIYGPMFTEMGGAVAAHPDQLVWDLTLAGFTGVCYDGQYFFDTDHPVLGADGNTISVANTDGGTGAAWFLVDDTRAIKPIIYQNRKSADFVAMDQDTDEKVFNNREFRYGTHSRGQVGYGFWQLIWGSKQTLDAAHYKTARAALGGMKGDNGRPLAVKPRKLLVGASNEEAALLIVGSKTLAGGGNNPWYGTAEVELVAWLP